MIAVVLGTRPELIKCAPVLLEAQRRSVPIEIIHTGQHYSAELDDIFFRELNLPAPILNLRIGSHAAPKQIGMMMEGLGDALAKYKPSAVLVQGDTNSVLAGALAANKLGIPVAHLEAGLRSDDWTMPEEANRVVADRLSRWLFCPTDLQKERLTREGITSGVSVVGNTIVDAALHYAKVAYDKSDIVERLGITDKQYVLLTMHRPSNVDDPARLAAMIRAIDQAASTLGFTVVFPIHPRTNHVMTTNNIATGSMMTTGPLGYLDLLRLQHSAHLVLTDSGGIQEEACILRVPSITLRPNTERPETLQVGASVLFHEPDAEQLVAVMRAQLAKPRDWQNPFGDGTTSVRVIDQLVRDMKSV